MTPVGVSPNLRTHRKFRGSDPKCPIPNARQPLHRVRSVSRQMYCGLCVCLCLCVFSRVGASCVGRPICVCAVKLLIGGARKR